MRTNNLQFFVLVFFLIASVFMDIQNASATSEIRGLQIEQGQKLDQQEGELKELNQKFGIFVAYMDNQRKYDNKQDKKIADLERKVEANKKDVEAVKKEVEKVIKK